MEIRKAFKEEIEKQHEETNECDVKSKGGKIVKES